MISVKSIDFPRPRYLSLLFFALASSSSLGGLCSAQGQSWIPQQRRWVTTDGGGLELRRESSETAPDTVGAGGSQSMLAGSTELIWSLTSDESWIAETVSLGNQGTQVFTEYGFYVNHAELLSSHTVGDASPAWSDQQAMLNFERQVASSKSADVHLSLHQVYADAALFQRRAVLRRYSSAGAGSSWSHESDILISNHAHSWCAVSDDGEAIVLLVYDQAQGKTQLSLFGPDSNVPTHQAYLTTLAGVESADLSRDGSTLVVSAPLKQLVYDLTIGEVAHETYTFGQPQYGGSSSSGDGSRVVFGTPGFVTVMERNGEGIYSELLALDLPSAHMLRAPALSDDGTTLVAGFQKAGQLMDARIVVVDLEQGALSYQLDLDGGGQLQNLVEDIQVSADGSRFAIGMWGDEDDLVPEVLVYDRDLMLPVLTDHLPGSVNSMDFSSTGDYLTVASKGVHANVWGGGGSVSLYRVGLVDVAINGAPVVGATVDVEHRVREGTSSQVLVSTGLLDTPLEDSLYGAGKLYLDPELIVELPLTTADGSHLAISPFLIPQGVAVGTSYYMQAIDLDDGSLSRDWTKLTVLP